MTARENLLALVEQLVHERCTVPEFEQAFYDRYLETSEGELSETDHAFFGRAQELLDWTGDGPSASERAWGWMSHAEYAAWLRAAHQRYLAGESIEPPAQRTETT